LNTSSLVQELELRLDLDADVVNPFLNDASQKSNLKVLTELTNLLEVSDYETLKLLLDEAERQQQIQEEQQFQNHQEDAESQNEPLENFGLNPYEERIIDCVAKTFERQVNLRLFLHMTKINI